MVEVVLIQLRYSTTTAVAVVVLCLYSGGGNVGISGSTRDSCSSSSAVS